VYAHVADGNEMQPIGGGQAQISAATTRRGPGHPCSVVESGAAEDAAIRQNYPADASLEHDLLIGDGPGPDGERGRREDPTVPAYRTRLEGDQVFVEGGPDHTACRLNIGHLISRHELRELLPSPLEAAVVGGPQSGASTAIAPPYPPVLRVGEADLVDAGRYRSRNAGPTTTGIFGSKQDRRTR
jgi:hypothetical protein